MAGEHDDDVDRPASAADVAELKTRLDELFDAEQRRRDADTSRERSDAADDVRDAKADLDTVARQLGISPESLRKAASDARTSERREEMRPILKELLDELRGDDDKQKPKPKRTPKPKPPAADADADAGDDGDDGDDETGDDEPPTKSHWSERAIGSLIR